MEAAEDRVQHIDVIRSLLQLDQFLVEPFQYLASFDQEVLQYLIVGIDSHGSYPLKSQTR